MSLKVKVLSAKSHKVLSAKSHDLSLIPGTQGWKKKTNCPLTSDLCTMAHIHPHTVK